ncbi:hypothetical protein F5Y08DRAFT_298409 [Xylaria arbuscula]|nr:hypothetical protein F5Y08DRAFT_298409 [Xylaria arbuscula]
MFKVATYIYLPTSATASATTPLPAHVCKLVGTSTYLPMSEVSTQHEPTDASRGAKPRPLIRLHMGSQSAPACSYDECACLNMPSAEFIITEFVGIQTKHLCLPTSC